MPGHRKSRLPGADHKNLDRSRAHVRARRATGRLGGNFADVHDRDAMKPRTGSRRLNGRVPRGPGKSGRGPARSPHSHWTHHWADQWAELTAVHDDGVRSVSAEVSIGCQCWVRVTRPLCRRDTTTPGATVVPVARHREPGPSTG